MKKNAWLGQRPIFNHEIIAHQQMQPNATRYASNAILKVKKDLK